MSFLSPISCMVELHELTICDIPSNFTGVIWYQVFDDTLLIAPETEILNCNKEYFYLVQFWPRFFFALRCAPGD